MNDELKKIDYLYYDSYKNRLANVVFKDGTKMTGWCYDMHGAIDEDENYLGYDICYFEDIKSGIHYCLLEKDIQSVQIGDKIYY